jgi:predicted nucleic acid-binding protein
MGTLFKNRGRSPHFGLEFYPVTSEVARYAGELCNQFRTKGRTLSLPDVTIAAICLTHKLTLMTDNRKDFLMPELRSYPST